MGRSDRSTPNTLLSHALSSVAERDTNDSDEKPILTTFVLSYAYECCIRSASDRDEVRTAADCQYSGPSREDHASPHDSRHLLKFS